MEERLDREIKEEKAAAAAGIPIAAESSASSNATTAADVGKIKEDRY